MGDHRDKFRLEPVEFFQPIVGLSKLLVCFGEFPRPHLDALISLRIDGAQITSSGFQAVRGEPRDRCEDKKREDGWDVHAGARDCIADHSDDQTGQNGI